MKAKFFFALIFYSTIIFAKEKVEIFIDGKEHNFIYLDAIQKMKSEKINFYNYITKRVEPYKGVSFMTFLEMTVPDHMKKIVEVELIAENDFKYYISMDLIRKTNAILSYERADDDKFLRYSAKNKILVPMGPLYLVWDLKDVPANERIRYTSVYQIKGINVRTDKLTFGIHEDAVDKSVYLGYQTYKKHCLSCHSLGNLGGDVSIDLVKRRTLEKKGETFILKYIIKPSAMNPKTKMLPLPEYKNKMELAQGVVDFLKFMQNPKELLDKKKAERDKQSYQELDEIVRDANKKN